MFLCLLIIFGSCIFGELEVGRHSCDLTFLAAVIRKNIIFCYVTPCSLVEIHCCYPEMAVNCTRPHKVLPCQVKSQKQHS